LVKNITNGHTFKCDWYKPVSKNKSFCFLLSRKFFGINKFWQNIAASDICFCYLFGIRIRTALIEVDRIKPHFPALRPSLVLNESANPRLSAGISTIFSQRAGAIDQSLISASGDSRSEPVLVRTRPTCKHRVLSSRIFTSKFAVCS